MDTVIDIGIARANFSNLLERAHAGEEITIAKAGQPYARLVPLEAAKERPLGFVRALFDETFLEPLSEDELDAWE